MKPLTSTLGLLALAACTRTEGADAGARPSPSATSVSPSASAPPPPTGCAGLAAEPCVLRAGCFLDQPKSGQYVCREARDACERAVRHADLIGTSIVGVTEEREKAAERACVATNGCALAGGKCSCPCEVFGHCNCTCGGGYLRRCMRSADAAKLADFPPR